MRIVDWEYAGMGDRYFDLGNLSVNNGFAEADDERLLTAYWREPCTARRFAALRLMRVMSDFREGMWGVVQTAISALDFDFDALRRRAPRARRGRPGRPARPGLAGGGAWRSAVSCPRAPAA